VSPLLIGFVADPSSPLLIGLRRVERGVRRLDPLLSESGDGRAAALSTVSSDREDEEEDEDRFGRSDPDRGADSLREEDLDDPELDEPDPEGVFERRPDERFSSLVACSRRFSLELEPEPDFEELREERFGGATRAVSQ